MYLKFCQIGLKGDFDTLHHALAEFDKLLAPVCILWCNTTTCNAANPPPIMVQTRHPE
jgi:hypothetical protein